MVGCTVPGFDVDRLLGRGWAGELWAARGRATGRPVVLRRLAIADDVASHARIRRAAARLVGVTHPHLIALRGVVSTEGAVVLVYDQVRGVSLDRVLAGQGPLNEAAVVTLAVPLAQALAAAHAEGVVHGRVTPSSVVLDDDGRPMLADAGVAALLDLRDRSTSPADDVRDLALMCRSAFAAGATWSPLAAVLAAATADDATRRPTASQLATAVYATGPAVAIRSAPEVAPLSQGDQSMAPRPSTRPRSHRRTVELGRRAGRRWAMMSVSLAAAAAAALTGLAWAGVDASAPGVPVTAPANPSSNDDRVVTSPADHWRSVLAALDARRASAFAAASRRQLSTVDAAGSPAMRRDRASLTELAARGLHVERLRLQPQSLHVASTSAQRVVLRVVDVMEPYELRTASGRLVATRPGRSARTWRVTLVRSAAGWRFFAVTASHPQSRAAPRAEPTS
jgi:tRNA A-37 threonylcarbamoyl transferase component Bud32